MDETLEGAKLTRGIFNGVIEGIEQLIAKKPEAIAKDVLIQLRMSNKVISAMFEAFDEEVKNDG